MSFDPKEYDRLLPVYIERFGGSLPTEQMPQRDLENAEEIIRECLRTGKPYEAPPLPKGYLT